MKGLLLQQYFNSYDLKKLIIVTPVKDSLATTIETIRSVRATQSEYPYYIFDDLSTAETRQWLDANAEKYNYKVIGLSDIVDTPSPNYRTTLKVSQQMALEAGAGLLLLESDVIATDANLKNLNKLAHHLPDAGMVASLTIDDEGHINFPYKYVKEKTTGVFESKRSLSFCCTLITNELLKKINFADLDENKDWFDVFVTKQSRALGFKNYLTRDDAVIHRPHSSRPWKNLKYTNPLAYYFKKFFYGRDKI